MVADYQNALKIIIQALEKVNENGGGLCAAPQADRIPLGISNRHVHISQKDLEKIFGVNYVLTPTKDLGQPGQYACQETIMVCGPKGCLEKVRILGPVRSETQVELLRSDCFRLGLPPVMRMSGDLDQTPGVTLIGPKGSVELKKGAIVAQRHIHMHTKDAQLMGYHDGQVVSIVLNGPRGGSYDNVIIRASDSGALECHVDIEEGNAMGASNDANIRIV